LKSENKKEGRKKETEYIKKWTSGFYSCEWKTCNLSLVRERVRAWLSVYFPPWGKTDLFYVSVGVCVCPYNVRNSRRDVTTL
jgi:hypothetical protein